MIVRATHFAVFLLLLASFCRAAVDFSDFYTDLEDIPNPNWHNLKEVLTVGENSYGPAYGSTIEVNRATVEVGPYANREINRPTALHSVCNSYIGPNDWGGMSRWYQEYGNTQVYRLFPGDDNIRNERSNAPRSETFGLVSWLKGDGWYEWSGRFTFLMVRSGAVLQIKHNTTYWSMQLILQENDDGTTDLFYVKLRDREAKTLLLPDVVGKGVDIKVLDDGIHHMVFVDGKKMVHNEMSDRPDGDDNRARWGVYTPKSAIDRELLIFVTGAYVGPMLADDGDLGDGDEPDQDQSGGEERCGEGFWDGLYDKLIPDFLKKWFHKNEYMYQDGSAQLQALKQYLDREPDAGFLEKYYSDVKNDGYGFF